MSVEVDSRIRGDRDIAPAPILVALQRKVPCHGNGDGLHRQLARIDLFLKRGEPLGRHLVRSGGVRMHHVGDAVCRIVPPIRHIDGDHGGLRGRKLRRERADRVVERRDVGILRELAARDDLRVQDDDVRILRPRRRDDLRMGVRRGGHDVRLGHVRRRGRVRIDVVVVPGMDQQNVRHNRRSMGHVTRRHLRGVLAAIPFARLTRTPRSIDLRALPFHAPVVRVQDAFKRHAVRHEARTTLRDRIAHGTDGESERWHRRRHADCRRQDGGFPSQFPHAHFRLSLVGYRTIIMVALLST